MKKREPQKKAKPDQNHEFREPSFNRQQQITESERKARERYRLDSFQIENTLLRARGW